MKIIKGVLIVVFLLLILFNISLTIVAGEALHKLNIVVLVTLILVLVYKTRVAWVLAVCLFTYAIFYFLLISTYKAEPGAVEFTGTLNTFIFGGYTGNPLRYLIYLFPFLFYTVSLIVFLTKPVRKLYNISV